MQYRLLSTKYMKAEKMKHSIAIPCYNSNISLNVSSLFKDWKMRILVVNDGSSDRTAEIADAYAEKYETLIIEAVHQENGGHGEAVMRARPLFKSCATDWVNEKLIQEF